MIKFINKSLFNITTEEKTSEKGSYFETTVSSSVEVKNRKTNEMNRRVITKIISDTEDFNAENTSIQVKTTKLGSSKVGLRSSNQNQNNTTIYLVAIPFNGIIKPIEKLFDYRIYKGIILTAEKRTIEFNNELYKKIAYMVLIPNETLFEEDHKYHKDWLELSVESYNLESNPDTDEKKCIKSISTVTFLKDGNDGYDIISEECEPVDPKLYKGSNIFPIYTPQKKVPMNNKKTYNKNYRDNREGRNYKEDHSEKSRNLEDMISDYNKQFESTHGRNKDNRKKKNRR